MLQGYRALIYQFDLSACSSTLPGFLSNSHQHHISPNVRPVIFPPLPHRLHQSSPVLA
ncbi:hypothetical protein BD779DRAFT_1519541 [Infundibulicybe gibba]|nr:hypothetical protein BD779DRAFT_1519541 [Infundibulicybe gibba]